MLRTIEDIRTALGVPKDWSIDFDPMIEGGQPNGAGEIEDSAYREWYRPERETHHRQHIVITIDEPWQEGPTEEGRRAQESLRARQRADEDRILDQAAAIRVRREAEGAGR